MPLASWTCDVCGEQITDPDTGLVTWRTRNDEGRTAHDFLVVHKNMDGYGCDPEARQGYTSNLDISAFLGDEGQARLLSMLNAGPLIASDRCEVLPQDMAGFVDLFRRMQTPWYEEARSRWADEDVQHWLGDASEVYPYQPEVLQRVAEHRLGH